MPNYFWFALAGAFCLSLYALVSKVVIRYRVCSPGFVTWGTGVGAGIASAVALAFVRPDFPSTALVPLLLLVLTILAGHWFLNISMQEGDASVVVPLLGLKIPMTATLAFFILQEAHSAWVYAAVLLSAGAVALFGIGRQEKAQGGRGRRPAFAIALACLCSLAYALSDQFAKLSVAASDVIAVTLWTNIFAGILCTGLLMHPTYRQYRVRALDFLLFLLGGAAFVVAMWALYTAFSVADGVTIPNIVLSCRGFFVLAVGYVLNKILRIPIERQRGSVYWLRAAGTALLFVAILIVLMR